jgi:hypothetical protein
MEVLILRELREQFSQVLKLRDLLDCGFSGTCRGRKTEKASGLAKGAAP